MKYGWDHPETARLYEQFCGKHARYRRANEALVAAAGLRTGMRVLDVGAGLGDTAALAIFECVGDLQVTCFEPAAAMRALGERRVPQARWIGEWPPNEVFDRVLCGAAVWQMQSLEEFFRRASDVLHSGGALVFNVPAQYIGQADEPGGGADPFLLQLPAALMNGHGSSANAVAPLPTAARIVEMLNGAGFNAAAWGFRSRLTQAEYRDWLRIPVLTDALLAEHTAEERIGLLDAAYSKCDPESWRWEAWRGWTAWK